MAYYYKDENGNMQIGSSVPDTDNGTADWNIEEEKSGTHRCQYNIPLCKKGAQKC